MGGRKPSCVFCGKIPPSLSLHLLRHINEKPIHCLVCGKEFNQLGHKKRHEQIHLSNSKSFSCSICKKGFIQKSGLTQHMLAHSEERLHHCPRPHCSYKAKWKSNLKVHLRAHKGEKRFICGLCGKRFVTSGNHQRHVITHTGEKVYKCDECGKRCTSKDWLQDHYRSKHLREKVHICRKCDKEFGYHGSLWMHRKTCTVK